MQSVPTTPPVLYIDLIETIISLLASESEEKPHTNDLSNCALVCRAWCNICRKISFANITTLDMIDSQNLHALLSARSQGALTHRNTIAKHVRAATVHVGLSEHIAFEGWDYAKELIMLFGYSFISNYQLRLVFNLDKIYRHHFLDIVSAGASQNLVYLALEGVTLSIDPEELSSLLCDASLPSLRELVNQRTTWIPEPIKYQRDSEKAGTNSRQSQCTLDFLSFDSVYCHPFHEQHLDRFIFWPHQVFQVLRVQNLKLEGVIPDTHPFWLEVPTLLRALSPHLTELDLSNRWIGYEAICQAIQGIQLTSLKTLKLKLVHKHTNRSSTRGAASEHAIAYILESIIMPQLSDLSISMYTFTKDTAGPIERFSGNPTTRDGWIHKYVEWDIIDPVLQSLWSKGLLNVYFNVPETDWEFSRISETDALVLLKEHLPKSVSNGLSVTYKILPVKYFFD